MLSQIHAIKQRKWNASKYLTLNGMKKLPILTKNELKFESASSYKTPRRVPSYFAHC